MDNKIGYTEGGRKMGNQNTYLTPTTPSMGGSLICTRNYYI